MPSRRQFLKRASAALGCGLPFAALSRRPLASGYGPLVPDPDGIFDLPEGFRYRVVQRRGDTMSDGFRAPGKMDGMTCFLGDDDSYVILRNQELNASHGDEERPFPEGAALPLCTHDPHEPGGVVRLLLDRKTLEVRDSRLVLYGTNMNCAGGTSPWGWLSCEEINDAHEADASLDHGYTFLVKPDDDGSNAPRPIRGYGRFRHEAAVVDARTLTCYLTEDRNDSCFYRFVPLRRERPFEGVLQALKVKGSDRFNTANGLEQGQIFDVEWVDIGDPRALVETTRSQAQQKGASIFARGEGIAEHWGDVYVCATTGGPQGLGQIFRYRQDSQTPFDRGTTGTLELLLQNEDESILAQPDNIVVSPWGDVVMCEDAINGNQHLRVLTRDGEVFDLGRNALSSLELAGVCFAPDGKALFVNLQHDGIMLAITGPFPDLPLDDRQPSVDLEASACATAPGENAGGANGIVTASGLALAIRERRRRSE